MITEKLRERVRKGVPIYGVRITVVKSHPDCGAQMKVGDTWEDNCGVDKDRVKGFVCPSAFAVLQPMVFALRYGAQFPNQKEPDSVTWVCPDLYTPVHFKIERLRNKVRWLADETEREFEEAKRIRTEE